LSIRFGAIQTVTFVKQFDLLVNDSRNGYQHVSKDSYSVLIFPSWILWKRDSSISSLILYPLLFRTIFYFFILLSVICTIWITVMQCMEINLCIFKGLHIFFLNRNSTKEENSNIILLYINVRICWHNKYISVMLYEYSILYVYNTYINIQCLS